MANNFYRQFTCALAAALLVSGALESYAADAVASPEAPPAAITLSLTEAVAVADIHSPVALRQEADVKIAGAAARGAQSQEKPSLSATTYGSVGDSSNILTSAPGVTPQNLFAVPSRAFADQNLTLMVPLSTGGRLRGAADAARRQSDAAALTTQSTRLGIDQSVTEAYVAVLLAQDLLVAAQARLDAEDEQVRVTGERVTTGRSAPVDLLREQAEQSDARQMLLSGQNDVETAKVNLIAALGLSQETQVALSDTLDTLLAAKPDTPGGRREALQEAEARRPETAAAQRQIEAAQAAVAAARGAYSPQVYAVAMGDTMAMQGGGRSGYTLGLAASLPIIDGGQRRADVDAAKARVDAARADAFAVRQKVDQESATAWLSLQTAQSRLASSAVGVAAAQQGYDLAQLRYNAGKSVAAERLDALSALTRAKSTQAQGKAALIVAREKMATALGRLGN